MPKGDCFFTLCFFGLGKFHKKALLSDRGILNKKRLGQRKDHVKTGGEDSHLDKPRRETSEEINPADTFLPLEL